MQIFTYLDLSTAHMTERDRQLLAIHSEEIPLEPIGITIAGYEEGFFVSLGALQPNGGENHQEIDARWRRLAAAGYSNAFVKVLHHAIGQGCQVVRFDRDGETGEGFEVFDW